MRNVEQVERVTSAESASADLRVRLYLTGEAAGLVAPVTELLLGRGARLTAISLGEPSLKTSSSA